MQKITFLRSGNCHQAKIAGKLVTVINDERSSLIGADMFTEMETAEITDFETFEKAFQDAYTELNLLLINAKAKAGVNEFILDVSLRSDDFTGIPGK